ncbi:MAG TPA: hypothetical protein PLD85_13075 [Spirochaetota bacterium]|nr:hypothetical protein [Spirochaetota bacterium]
MKLIFIKCPNCKKLFYCETLLTDNKMPLHCPGCDIFIQHTEYVNQLGSATSSALTRIRRPLNEATVKEVLYIPLKKG